MLAIGLLAFALLAIRFSPNWINFSRELSDGGIDVSRLGQDAATDRAILSGYSDRGFYVLQQAHDLNAEIADSNHKIIRWRLLVPALAHYLHLPGWWTLALAQIGCLAFVMALVAIGSRPTSDRGKHPVDALCLAVVGGATAPFFTSMGWLGYYDSWLALALLVVAFAPRHWPVVLACVLGPWIDERFVIGLPLALMVRRSWANPSLASEWNWFKAEALWPVILVSGYTLLRLKLGGSGGSQTVHGYLDQFVFGSQIPVQQRAFAAWSGLRLGWVLAGVAVLFGGRGLGFAGRFRIAALGGLVVITALIGLFTALDMSRSMVLLLPVVPLGWEVARRASWWRNFCVAPILAGLALFWPARHVVGNTRVPVDNIWHPSLPLLTAENNLGLMYAKGHNVRPDAAEARRWFQKAADHGYAEAQNNLGVLYQQGDGVPRDMSRAVDWFRRAAEQGCANAENNLGLMYAHGDGVPQNNAEAFRWIRRAAEQNFIDAQHALGLMYAQGTGVARNGEEAVNWFRRAAMAGHNKAQFNLAAMYANGDGVPKDLVEAYAWFALSGMKQPEAVTTILVDMTKHMTPEELSRARQRVEKLSATMPADRS